MLPNSSTITTFEFDDKKVCGSFGVDANGKVIINIDPKRNNPKNSKAFIEKIVPKPHNIFDQFFQSGKMDNESTDSSFLLNLHRKYDERRCRVALLRIAYLLAFSKFGNGFLINEELYKIREQILHPDKDILGGVFWVNYQFPDNLLGLNFISHPKELQCLLVIFKLKTKSGSRQFSIMLPGPSAPGMDIYKFYQENLCSDRPGETVSINIEHVVDYDYLKIKENAYASHILWRRYTSPDYKPNFAPK
ncbi:hypothetical protein [Sphingobacterium sp.]|uniref:hypothetical protein n=1 Tax=Sphingobacterium sp. TaxID=341027 RepID=UPI0028A09A79|nr:hypothetical protein [Sphingobacterium sp.]